MPRPLLSAALTLPLLACAAGEPADGLQERAACEEVWGPEPAGGRVHVRPDGDRDGDGSADAPFADLEAALEATRAGRAAQIAIEGGELEASLLLGADFGDDGLQLLGCGAEATTLRARADDGGRPVLDITGEATADLLVRDLALVGGRRSLQIRDGAGASGAVRVENVRILDSRRLGVFIGGSSTVAELREVVVDGVEPDVGDDNAALFGWGIAVATRRQLGLPFEAPVVLQNVEVLRTVGLGVYTEGAWLLAEDLRVDGVAQVGGRLGRGVQLQDWSVAELSGLVSRGNRDSAVFLASPGRPDPDSPDGPPLAVELFDSLLGPTAPSPVAETGQEASDGVVATQPPSETPYPPDTFRVVLDRTELAGNERAHALADAVAFEVGSNNVFGKGTFYPLVGQAGAIVSGLGGGEPGEEAVQLGDDEALAIDHLPLGPTALD